MVHKDKKKTSFTTDRGLNYYRIMSFGLKNVGTIYQHLVGKIFNDQVSRNIEVYNDGMLMKNMGAKQHMADLYKLFMILRRYCMKLNSSKYTFGVTIGNMECQIMPNRVVQGASN